MIRRFLVRDFAAWQALRLEALENYPTMFGSTAESTGNYDEVWFERFLSGTTVFVDEREGSPVGMAGLILSHGNKAHQAGIVSVYVKKAYQRQGIAEALIRHIIAVLPSEREQLRLTVSTHNQGALKLYEKLGFSVYATDYQALKVGNTYYDEYLMVKKLK